MNRRNTIIGVLVVAAMAVFVLWDGDEPEAPAPEPSAERQAREPTARRPGPGDADWYGRLREPAAPSEAPRTLRESAQPWYYGPPQVGAPPYSPGQPSYPQQPGYGGTPGYGYAPSYPPAPERYHFRPLTEQERERMEQRYPVPAYPDPYYSVPEPRQEPPPAYAGPGAPEAWPGAGYGGRRWSEGYGRGYPDGGYAPERQAYEPRYPQQPYPEWQTDSYRFRAPERPAATDRWQSPEQGYGWWDTDPNRGNAWTPPPADGWDRTPPSYTPPSERMYPSLPHNPDRRFTYR